METALQAVLSLATPAGQPTDVILITDGEIYNVAGVVHLAATSRHRLFAIAIGAAPNEALARSLAEDTGGACEFVAPTEDAETAILRTFARLRSQPRTLGRVQWPTPPEWTAPVPSAVFPGDTLHLLAGFSIEPKGSIGVTVEDAAGQVTTIHLPVATSLTHGDLVSRLAAARRIASLDEAAARDLAVNYQLATRYTSFVVVAERSDIEKANGLPLTIAVPHMLAAGWGGSASVRLSASASFGAIKKQSRSFSMHATSSDMDDDDAALDIPAFLRRSDDVPARVFSPSDRAALLQSLFEAYKRGESLPSSIAELSAAHPLTPKLVAALRKIVTDSGKDESEIVKVLLALLLENSDMKGLDRDFRAAMRGSFLGSRAHRSLRSIMLKGIFT